MNITEVVKSAMSTSFVDSYRQKDTNRKGQADPSKILTYTPWAKAVEEALKIDPEFTWGVNKPKSAMQSSNGGVIMVELERNYFTDGNTCWVETWTRLGGKTVTMTLPVMDGKNIAIPTKAYEEIKADGSKVYHPAITSNDVNKAIMRCLVKTLAIGYGLGLSIYYGEEMSEEQVENACDNYISTIESCGTVEELVELYNNPEFAALNKLPKVIKAITKRQKEITKK